jgi:hypothetical protein
MKRVICFGLSVLVNAFLVGALQLSSTPTPDGKVFISELNVASHAG